MRKHIKTTRGLVMCSKKRVAFICVFIGYEHVKKKPSYIGYRAYELLMSFRINGPPLLGGVSSNNLSAIWIN